MHSLEQCLQRLTEYASIIYSRIIFDETIYKDRNARRVMKIAVLSSIGRTLDSFFPPLVHRWRESGNQVIAASAEQSIVEPHTSLKMLTRNPSPKNALAWREIADWLRREQADVLLTNTAVASFVSRLAPQPCPIVYFCHGLHWNTGTTISERVWKALEAATVRNTSGVITINSDDETWFRRRMPADQILRLRAGVGLPTADYPRQSQRPVADDLNLIWAGEFSHRKRPALAVQTVKSQAFGVRVRLTMCGQGPLRVETERLITELGLENSITLAGHVSDLGVRLAGAHALIMTSTWEGLPRVGLEALAVGRPVFAFDVKGVRSLPNVHTVPEPDPTALAKVVIKAAEKQFSDATYPRLSELDASVAADEMAWFMQKMVA